MSTVCDSAADQSPADTKFLLGGQDVTLLWIVLPCFCAASKVRTIREMKSLLKAEVVCTLANTTAK